MMKKQYFSLASPLLSCLLIFIAINCTKNPVAPQDTETLIRNLKDMDGVPSVAACIIKNDQIVWQYAYGSANREEGISATDETVYLIASISKTVTSAAVMKTTAMRTMLGSLDFPFMMGTSQGAFGHRFCAEYINRFRDGP